MKSFDGPTLKYTVAKVTNPDGIYAHIKFCHFPSDECQMEVCCLLSLSIHSLILFYSISSLVEIPYVLLRFST
jgi:hypothetical protein